MCVCVCQKKNSIKKCVWLGSNLLPFAFFATSTLSLAASRHASLRAFAFPSAKADTMTHRTTTTAELLFSRENRIPIFRSRDVILSQNNIRRFSTKNVSHEKDELEEKREKLGLQLRTLVVMEDDRDDDVAEQVENEGLLAGRGGAR